MIKIITRAVARLDAWLHAKLGTPYRALLGVGLTIEIVRRLIELPKMVGSGRALVPLILLVAMDAALLIHQIAEFAEHEAAPEPGGAHGE